MKEAIGKLPAYSEKAQRVTNHRSIYCQDFSHYSIVENEGFQALLHNSYVGAQVHRTIPALSHTTLLFEHVAQDLFLHKNVLILTKLTGSAHLNWPMTCFLSFRSKETVESTFRRHFYILSEGFFAKHLVWFQVHVFVFMELLVLKNILVISCNIFVLATLLFFLKQLKQRFPHIFAFIYLSTVYPSIFFSA